MTHHDTPVDRDTIEILRDGKWSTVTPANPAEARWLWQMLSWYVFDRTGPDVQRVNWAIWKQPSKTRGYVARAHFGKEPDCPNCCAAGCPQATLPPAGESQCICHHDSDGSIGQYNPACAVLAHSAGVIPDLTDTEIDRFIEAVTE